MNYTDYTYNPSDWTKHRDRDSNSVWWENVNTGKTVYNDPAIASDSLLNELYNPNFGQEVAGISDGGLTSIGLHLNPLNAPVDYGNGITSSYTRAPTGFVNELTGRSFVQNPDGSTSPYTGQAGIPTVRYDPNAGNAGHGSWWDQQGTELVGDALYGAAGYFGGPIAGAMLSLGQDNSAESRRNMQFAGLGSLAGSILGTPSTSGANISSGDTGTAPMSGGNSNLQFASASNRTDVPIGEKSVDELPLDAGEAGIDSSGNSMTNYNDPNWSQYNANSPSFGSSDGNTFDSLFNSPTGQQIVKALVGSAVGKGGTNTNTAGSGMGGLLGSLMEYLGQRRLQGQYNASAESAAARTDPFGGQRPFYQDLYKQSYTDPNFFTNSSVFKGLNDYAVDSANRRMAAGGFNMSGNQMQELTKTAATTGYNYALPFQAQLGQAAGAGIGPGYAGFLQQQGQNMGAQAGLSSQGALGNLFGGALRQLSGMS